MGAVGIIRGLSLLSRCDNVRILLLIMLGQPVGCGLRRRGLQVIKIAVLLLIIRQALSHMIQHLLRKLLTFRLCHIPADP